VSDASLPFSDAASMQFPRLAATASVAFLGLSLFLGPTPDPVPYPFGYREWTHVKSALIGPQNPAFDHWGGIHHIYANGKAMEGYRSGNFPAGAVLVFDVLSVTESSDGTSEGPRRLIDVMHRESGRYPNTGGWGFEEFRADSHTDRALDTNGAARCFACHASRKAHGFVFSYFRP
jgi:cytochrome P460